MAERRTNRLSRLGPPEGLLVDAAWLSRNGFAPNLRSYYVATGRLEQPARRVYSRPNEALSWQQAVVSLQTLLLRDPIAVGGRTALELHGFERLPKQGETEVYLYGPKPPPTWLQTLPLSVRFIYRNDRTLFRNEPLSFGTTSLTGGAAPAELAHTGVDTGFTVQPWGEWDLPLTLSTPERAVLEWLGELPARETFEQTDKLFEALSSLRPHRLNKLLGDCRSVKVKRLFFFFAARHPHAWTKCVDREGFDLGKGNCMLVTGGRFDPALQITVPKGF